MGSDEIEITLYEACEWWIKTYPEDIFVNEPKEVVQIRRLMKEILKKEVGNDRRTCSYR